MDNVYIRINYTSVVSIGKKTIFTLLVFRKVEIYFAPLFPILLLARPNSVMVYVIRNYISNTTHRETSVHLLV